MVNVQAIMRDQFKAEYFCEITLDTPQKLIMLQKFHSDAPVVKLSNGRTVAVAPKKLGKWSDVVFFEKKGISFFRAWKPVQLNDQERLAIESNLKIGSKISLFKRSKELSALYLPQNNVRIVPTIEATVQKSAKVLYKPDNNDPTVFYENKALKVKLSNGRTLIVAPEGIYSPWNKISAFEKKGILRNWTKVKLSDSEFKFY